MSFFEELKRRNVFRVGAAYAVAAFVVLQLLDALGEILELPAWGGKLILAIIVVGFFVALLVAWAFELTPEGVKREKDVDRSQSVTYQTGKKLNTTILVLMAVAIAYLLFDRFYLSHRLEQVASDPVQSPATSAESPGTPAANAVAAVSRQSIAVLPFDNRSRLEDDAFFVEGIHDDLLSILARIGSLKVISRTSVSQYKGTTKTIPQIASELGVATVMEGAVQRSGNTVRINVQLIDAQTDEHLWAEIFDRELTADNLFAIQSEISEEIARALQTTLSPEEQLLLEQRPTENLAAYNAYLRGRQLMARRNSADVDQAAAEFRRAVEFDPEFALAWVGVSESAMLQSQYSDLGFKESREIQQQATERALALNDRLGEAYLSQAEMLAFQRDNDAAEAAYRKAIELSPGYATAYQWYGNFLADFPSRLSDSLEMLQRALELDPLSSIVRSNLAGRYIRMGRYVEAERQLERLEEIDPGFVQAFSTHANLAEERGRFDEQIRWLLKSVEADPGRLTHYIPLMWAYVNIDYVEPLEDIKRRMAAISEENALVGVADLIINLRAGNYEAALEAGRWAYQRMGRPPFFNTFFGYTHALNGDYDASLQAFELAMPELFDRDRWSQAVGERADDGCFVGWLMLRAGDPTKGEELIRASLDYLEYELPRYVQHADRHSVAACHMALGNTDRALAAIETRVEHGHYGQWWIYRKSLVFEPLWGDPRFEAAMQKIQDEIAIQRENLQGRSVAALF